MIKSIKLILAFSILIISCIYCTSLKQVQFKQYPSFESNADKIMVQYEHRAFESTRTYIFENLDGSKRITFIVSNAKSNTERRRGDLPVHVYQAESGTGLQFSIWNPLDSTTYIIEGEIIQKGIVAEGSKSYTEMTLSTKGEFKIFHQNNQIGLIKLKSRKFKTDSFEILINDRKLNHIFEKRLSSRHLSFEHENELVAFLELHSKTSFGSERYEGDFFIKDGLDKHFYSDILVSSIVADILNRFIEDYEHLKE